MFVGLPGAGKSHFYRARFARTHALLSKDLMSNSRRSKTQRQVQSAREILSGGGNVAIDNTNISRAQREPLLAVARECGARVTGYYFAVSRADCRERNASRTGKACVPDFVIAMMANALQVPAHNEGFDTLWRVTLAPDGAPIVSPWRTIERETAMNSHLFEAKMRAGEAWHGERVPDDKWAIVRVDGRGFSRLTEKHFEKPFDPRFYDLMAQTARALLREWQGIYAYFESDEISLLLPHNFNHFGRGHEKLVSLCAATASVHFTQLSGEIALFDARIWIGDDRESVADYFRWRQSDAARCALNGWCYWTLRAQNQTARAATRALDGLTKEDKTTRLGERGIHWDELPMWQRRGAGWHWETYTKQGTDPHKGAVTARRRRLALNDQLPWGAQYGEWLRQIIGSDCG